MVVSKLAVGLAAAAKLSATVSAIIMILIHCAVDSDTWRRGRARKLLEHLRAAAYEKWFLRFHLPATVAKKIR